MAAGKTKKGCLILAWTFLGLVILGIIFAPEEKTSSTTDRLDAKGKPEKAISDPKAAARAFYINTMSAMGPCDRTSKKASDLLSNIANGSNIYEAYSAADQAETACQESWSEVGDVTVPAGLSSKNQDKAEETKEMCQSAMIARQTGFEAIKEVLDGDARPSKVAEATEKAERAQGALLVCAAYLAEIATVHKLDIDELNKAAF